MRIEYQGTVEARPPFQHVGYVASLVLGTEYRRVGIGDTVGAGLAAVGLALALMAVRRRRAPRARNAAIALAAVLALGAVVCFAADTSDFVLHHRLSPRFAATLLSLEQLVAQTDRVARDLRRSPTPREWYAQFGEVKDAWGNGFVYRSRHTYQMVGDGRGYEILSTNGHGTPDREDLERDYGWMVLSVWLGPDGVAGTSDDYERLTEELRRCRVDDHAQLERIASRAVAPDAAEGS